MWIVGVSLRGHSRCARLRHSCRWEVEDAGYGRIMGRVWIVGVFGRAHFGRQEMGYRARDGSLIAAFFEGLCVVG